jgi:1-acyl-sn-glycerol-3-phosphate acyltransferase
MIEALERGWRVLATGLAFALFGLGGLLIWLLYLPLLQLLIRDERNRRRHARSVIQHCFWLFIEFMQVVGILRYRVAGEHKLQRTGLLIVANHPTLIDVVFLISLVRNADCVVKSSLATNPFTRGALRATGYTSNDSGVELVEACIASLRAGNNLIIFPEGTRSVEGHAMRLKRGAANIAVRGRCNLTPVEICCRPLSLTKGLPWWRVPPRRMQFTIEVRDDIAVEPFIVSAGGEALAARRLTDYLRTCFSPEQVHHAGA